MDILRQHVRPDETSGAQPVHAPIYWKTGTSPGPSAMPGRRACSAPMCWWYGSAISTARGNPAFVGVGCRRAAVFPDHRCGRGRTSRRCRSRPAQSPPASSAVEICLASGDLPNQWCPQRGRTWFIPGKSPIRVSNVHRPVMIDDATGRPACPPYAGKRVHQELYEFWPSDLQEVFAKAGIPRRKPPQNPDCANAGEPEGCGAAHHLAPARRKLCAAAEPAGPPDHRA